MKKIILLVAMIIIMMACNRNGLSIKVSKTAERNELVAEYPDRKDKRLNEYLKVAFGPDSLLLKDGIHTGKEIKLANGAVFYLRHNPGKLEMEMLLEKNNLRGRRFFDDIDRTIKTALD